MKHIVHSILIISFQYILYHGLCTPMVCAATPAQTQVQSTPTRKRSNSVSAPLEKASEPHNLYVRFNAGYGLMVGEGTITREGSSKIESYYTGKGITADISVGKKVLPFLVLGGSLMVQRISEPKITLKERANFENFGSATNGLVAAFIDFLSPQHTGWHGSFALGVAFLTRTDPITKSDFSTAFGPGLSFDFGYDIKVSEKWSIGLTARLGSHLLFGKTPFASSGSETYFTKSVSALINVLYF